MPSGPGERYDFFLSRRGSVAAIAQEVTDVLKEKGYRVFVQDYDIPLAASFIDAMHEGIKNSRDLIVLYTEDYESSRYTRREFTSFEAERGKTGEERHIIVLRCEDVPLRGLLADNVYQSLVGIKDPEERKCRIIAAAERHSSAEPPPPRPFIGVPPRIASFTGRADELDRLDAILMRDKPAAETQASVGRAAVHGMGGVGKTSLAIEYAYRFRGLYAGVCWCPAETRIGLSSALAGLAMKLEAATAEDTADKAAKAALSRLAEKRATWLLVYDNVTAPNEISDLLPLAGARVLITSHFLDWREWADEVALDALPLEEAVAFLQNRAGRSDPSGARILAEVLGRLPLALDHAAAYCIPTQMRFADYAEKAASLIEAVPRGVSYPRSIAATVDLAITKAVAQSRAAEALMAYLAECAPERIPMTLVEGALEDQAARIEALAAVTEVSLVKSDPFDDDTPAVTVHRLVQAATRARSQGRSAIGRLVAWLTARGSRPAQRLIARLVAILPDQLHNRQSWLLCIRLTPHLVALRAHHPDEGSFFADYPDYPTLLDKVAYYFLINGGYYRRSEDFLTGGMYGEAGSDLAEGRMLFERALKLREKILGLDHADAVLPLARFGRLFLAHGDVAGARTQWERALAISEKTLGQDHVFTTSRLNELGMLLTRQGEFAAARPLLERALAIHEKKFGPNDPHANHVRCNLARLHLFAGSPTEALALGETALAALVDHKLMGPVHPWTKDCARVNADALDAVGRMEEAKALRERYGLPGDSEA